MTTYYVTNANDSGAGSLREALATPGADVIDIDSSAVLNISLQSGLVITHNVTINATLDVGGGPVLQIDGQSSTTGITDLTINAGVTAVLSGLIITGGNGIGTDGAPGTESTTPGNGGPGIGGINDQGTVFLTHSYVQNNFGQGGNGGNGRSYQGGGGGGVGVGGVYVASGASLSVDNFSFVRNNSYRVVGNGGNGGGGSADDGSYAVGGQGGSDDSAGSASSTTQASNSGLGGGGAGPTAPHGDAGGDGNSFIDPAEDSETGPGGGGGAGTNQDNVFEAAGSTVNTDSPPVCFVTGTRIRTTRGDVAVEALRVGDRAVTASGVSRPIVWIGHRTLRCHSEAPRANPESMHTRLAGEDAASSRAVRHPLTHGFRGLADGKPRNDGVRTESVLPADSWPIRIRAGAFGGDRPERDLRLSPGHPVLVGETLVPIMCLVNGTTIARVPVPSVTYWHVELDTHDVLLAEGLPAESFLDIGNRAWFDDASDDGLTNPDFIIAGLGQRCRPVVVEGASIEAERRRLDMLFATQLTAQCAWSAPVEVGLGF